MEYKFDKSRFFEIPKHFYYEAGNPTVGSLNSFNYRIAPKDGRLFAAVWYGMLCFELCEPVAQKDFDGGFDGYKEMIYWLDEQYEEYLEKLRNGEVEPRRTYEDRNG